MTNLPEFLETIEPYVEDGYWFDTEFEEAVHMFLHKQFGELFKRGVQVEETDNGNS